MGQSQREAPAAASPPPCCSCSYCNHSSYTARPTPSAVWLAAASAHIACRSAARSHFNAFLSFAAKQVQFSPQKQQQTAAAATQPQQQHLQPGSNNNRQPTTIADTRKLITDSNRVIFFPRFVCATHQYWDTAYSQVLHGPAPLHTPSPHTYIHTYLSPISLAVVIIIYVCFLGLLSLFC